MKFYINSVKEQYSLYNKNSKDKTIIISGWSTISIHSYICLCKCVHVGTSRVLETDREEVTIIAHIDMML